MSTEGDPVERLRALAQETPGLKAVVAAVCALAVGVMVAAASGALDASRAEIALMGVLSGIGAIPAVFLLLR
jgi:hypothetical protein